MRGTVGEPRTAANTHSVRIPPAGDRVCHQVQLPVQAVALRVAGRRPQLHNQEGKQSSSAVGALPHGWAPAGAGGGRSVGCARVTPGGVWDRPAWNRPHCPLGYCSSGAGFSWSRR